jgi:chromosome segregation ATPase
MIDKQLIESAKYIRNDFLSLTENLLIYQEEVKKLGNFFLNKSDDLRKYNDDVVKKIKSKNELSIVTNYILKEIQQIEDEEKKLSLKVEDVNQKMEKLRKDEMILYQTIRDRYPDLSDDEIRKEIHSNLDK